MSRIYVKIGPKSIRHIVDGLPFLPGLCMHRMPTSGKISELYNITHNNSGLAVLSSVAEKNLELARMVLGRLLWDRSSAAIFEDERYHKLMEEADAVLTNHERSKKQEKRIAEDVGGKRQPASGSRWGCKRDIVSPRLLIEAKTTRSAKQAVSIKDLHFLTKQAYQQGKIPAYVIELGSKEEVVVIHSQDIAEDVFSEFNEQKEINCQTKKSFSITSGLVDWLGSDNCALIVTSSGTYALLNYYFFLEVAKRGL